MQRQRIMQGAANAIGFKMLLQFVAPRMPNNVKVISTLGVSRLTRQLERCFSKKFVITMRDATTLASPFFQILQFHPENGSLHSFHAVIKADLIMILALRGTVLAERFRSGGKCRVIGH